MDRKKYMDLISRGIADNNTHPHSFLETDLEREAAEGLARINSDFNKLSKVMRALQLESNARNHLAAIIDSANDAIISKNLEGIVQSWNPAAEIIFGYTAEEMVGHSIMRLIPKGCEEEEMNILFRLRAGERISNHFTRRVHKNGHLVPVALTISPIKSFDGKIVGASKIARDISMEQKAKIAQEELIERLQKALAEIKTLRGLIPICMHCKSIRNDQGYWQALEAYFDDHSEFKFTHGICPKCYSELNKTFPKAKPE
jgi:PAS domain S-box-containing protein